MTPRIQKKLRQPRSREPLHVTHRHAAGIDVHANVHWVAVAPEDAPSGVPFTHERRGILGTDAARQFQRRIDERCRFTISRNFRLIADKRAFHI